MKTGALFVVLSLAVGQLAGQEVQFQAGQAGTLAQQDRDLALVAATGSNHLQPTIDGEYASTRTSSSSSSEGPSEFLVYSANASNVNYCVSVHESPDGSVGLLNGCNDKLAIMSCVDNPSSNSSCGSTAGGLWWTLPGATAPLPNYKENGGGHIYWGACVSPLTPKNWRRVGATFSFECS
jgi:hypothetical protein